MDEIEVTPGRPTPPVQGRGSSKSAWIDHARYLEENGVRLWDIVNKQSEAIRELQAEVSLLRGQIAARKPKGGRPRTDEKKIAQIESDLSQGYSRRNIARRCGVSPMTVQRVAERIAARGAISP